MVESTTARLQFVQAFPGQSVTNLQYTDTMTITTPAWNRQTLTLASGNNTFTTTKTDATVFLIPGPGTTGTWTLKGVGGDTGTIIRNDQPTLLPLSGAAGTTFVLNTTVTTDQLEYIEV